METNLSRRGFLTGAAAAGALAAMGLAGCAPTPAAEGGTKTADTGAAAATSWRDKPEMPTEFVETVDADIVVVGAGNGGLVAATTAAQNGAKVVVLEKAGAIAAAREAIGALNSKLAPDHQEDVPTLLNHANQTQAGDANMLMYKTWAEKSGEMIEWMADTLGPKGMLFPFEWHCPDDPHAYYPAMCYNPCLDEYNPDGPNYTSYTHLEVMADVFTTDLGGEIRFETPAQQLLIDEAGRVTGVVAEGKEGFIQVNAAKGVIICTGGYGANNEMLADLAPGNSAWCALRDSVTETGDGIRMALWAGAELEAGGACMIWNRAILPDGFEFNEDRMGGDIFLPGSQPFLHVNVNGERFINESLGRFALSAAVMKQPEEKLFIISDALNSGLVNGYNEQGYSADKLIEESKLFRADSIEELAQMIGADPSVLAKAVDDYNAIARGDVADTVFGRENMSEKDAIVEAPFYASPRTWAAHVTIGGVAVGPDYQALTADGAGIEGLYVVGECSDGNSGVSSMSTGLSCVNQMLA